MKIYEKFKVKFLVVISLLILANMAIVYIIQGNTFNAVFDTMIADNLNKTVESVEKGINKKKDYISDIGLIVANSNDASMVIKSRDEEHVNINIDRYVHNFPDMFIEIFDKNGERVAKGVNVSFISKNEYIQKAVQTPFYFTEIVEERGLLYMKNYSTIRDTTGNIGTAVVSTLISKDFLNGLKPSSLFEVTIYNESHSRIVSTQDGESNTFDKSVKVQDGLVFKNGHYITAKSIFGKKFTLEMVFNNEKSDAMKKKIMMKVWYVNLAFILISLIILNMLATTIIKPMNEIIKGLNELRGGNLEYRILSDSNDEIGAAIKFFNSTAEFLKETKENEKRIYSLEKIASAGRLASGVAHEIKNPLASMDMIIEVYRRKFDTIKFKKEDFDLLSGEIKRINNILESLMNFSRNEKITIDEYNICEITADIINLVDKNVTACGNEIASKTDSPEYKVMCDKNLIKQMLLNLILNANEAVEKGRIEVDISGDVSKIDITISDTGSGIEEAIMNKIFEPFFTTKVNGNGIGLAIVKKIADIHEFNLNVISSDIGTKFIISINREKNKKLKIKNIDISEEIFFRRKK